MNELDKEFIAKAKNALILDNLRVLCVKNHTSIPKVEKELGYGNGSISSWKKAKKVAPRERVQAVADYFGVPITELITENGVSFGTSPEITEDTTTFPVLGEIAAHYDCLALESWTGGSIEIPNSYLKGRSPKDYFVLQVRGDSMHPDFQNGDHVLVLRQTTMNRSGEVGVVIYNDESATLKRVEYVMGEDWMTLRPINPQYPPTTVRGEALEHCKVLGVAKMVIREVQ